MSIPGCSSGKKPILYLVLLCATVLFSRVAVGQELRFHPSAKYPDFPFSEAVSYNGVLYLSGEVGSDAKGRLVEGGIGAESRQVMENIKLTLAAHGLAMHDILKCTVYLAEISEWPAFNEAYAPYFKRGRYPARSALAASGLALGARVEVECLAAALPTGP